MRLRAVTSSHPRNMACEPRKQDMADINLWISIRVLSLELREHGAYPALQDAIQ